jgi:hypothetical protein
VCTFYVFTRYLSWFLSVFFSVVHLWNKVLLCNPDWPCPCYVALAGLNLPILLPQPPKYWDYRHAQSCPACCRSFYLQSNRLLGFSSRVAVRGTQSEIGGARISKKNKAGSLYFGHFCLLFRVEIREKDKLGLFLFFSLCKSFLTSVF